MNKHNKIITNHQLLIRTINTRQSGTWIIHGGTRKITVCSSTFYDVNSNFYRNLGKILKIGGWLLDIFKAHEKHIIMLINVWMMQT